MIRRYKRRKWFFGVIFLLALVVLGPYLISRMSATQNRIRLRKFVLNQPQIASPAIKIVTYNLAHGRGPTDDNWEEPGANKQDRIRKIAKLLSEINADVIVLNEVDFNSSWSGGQNQAAAIANQAGYPYLVEQRNLDFRVLHRRWDFGNAILSKHPIQSPAVVNFPAAKNWENWLVGCKRGVVCKILPPNHPAFRVLAVHLEHRIEAVRVESARMIAELAKAEPTPLVAAGDFNSTPASFPASQHTAANENAMDLLIASQQFQRLPVKPPTVSEMTFSSYQPKSTIDWILFPTSWRCENYRAYDSELSDHRPVMAELWFASE